MQHSSEKERGFTSQIGLCDFGDRLMAGRQKSSWTSALTCGRDFYSPQDLKGPGPVQRGQLSPGTERPNGKSEPFHCSWITIPKLDCGLIGKTKFLNYCPINVLWHIWPLSSAAVSLLLQVLPHICPFLLNQYNTVIYSYVFQRQGIKQTDK